LNINVILAKRAQLNYDLLISNFLNLILKNGFWSGEHGEAEREAK